MLSLTDPAVQLTVLDMASQVGGKTEIIINAIGYFMHWNPTNIIVMYPTIETAEKFSKKKLAPGINATPVLKSLVNSSRTRDSGNTILTKDFLGGSIFMVGANSTPSLRGATGEVLIADEVDSYEDEAGDEGDSLELLWKRGESFPEATKLMASTPTVEGLSRIDNTMQETDYQLWFVPCPRCGEFQPLRWRDENENPFVVWPKGEPEKAAYQCVRCNALWTDTERVQAYYAGHWRATKPFKGKRGFHLNGIYAPWPHQRGYVSRLHQMAEDSIRAARKETTLKVWVNTFLCEAWKLKGVGVEPGELMGRCRTWDGRTLDARCLIIVGGADVQGNRIEVEFIGYGADDESWGLGYFVLMGDTDKPDVWQRLDELLAREWDHPCGQKLQCARFFIDSQHRPRHVFKFTKPRENRGIYGCQGAIKPWSVLCARPTLTAAQKATKYAVGKDVAIDITYTRLMVGVAGPRYCHFPVGYGYDENYFKQLTSYKLVVERDDAGIEVKKVWHKMQDRREAIDIRCYALGALESWPGGVNWKILAKKMAVAAPDVKEPVSPPAETAEKTEQPNTTTPRPSFRQRPNSWRGGGGFRGGWR